MRPRPGLRRVLFRPSRPSKPIRTFTQNPVSLYSNRPQQRPQLPFLSMPTFQRQQWRYFTSERKSWIRHEVIQVIKYTGYLCALLACLKGAQFAINEEIRERKFPTPHEWAFRTRVLFRLAAHEMNRSDVVVTNWVLIIQIMRRALARLEDQNIDGKGLRDMGREHPPGTKDISAMPEAWRRGYFEAVMLMAKAAEHVDGWVCDETRRMAFPPQVVRGPSNPYPRPIQRGFHHAPREEDCVPAGFPSPDELYLKLLATQGLTSKQRMQAALAYASCLEHKKALIPAGIMYEDAVNMAIEEIYSPGSEMLIDPATGVLNDKARKPSANLLTSLTGLATFKARHEDPSSALPILISILKARRSLPKAVKDIYIPTTTRETNPLKILKGLFDPPAYPLPPDDGTSPPTRDNKELCEEAALHLHIGEIMYTLQQSTREEGLSWTREAVDIAEEELHKLGQNSTDTAAQKTCRECLAAGLDNWANMVAMLAKEEAVKREIPAPKPGWFDLWGGDGKVEDTSRWAAEEKVVKERTRRAQEVLEVLEKPSWGLLSWVYTA